MKVLTIGDVHGESHWKDYLSRVHEFDKIIFLGDYYDSFYVKSVTQIRNLKEILDFKKANFDKVVLLLGNHDIAYLDHRLACSGTDYYTRAEKKKLINSNLRFFEYVHVEKDYIFSHGGLSKEWLGKKKIEDLNKKKPICFQFVGPNGYGDNLDEGPLWIRPNSLVKTAVEGYNQVVGHTGLTDGLYTTLDLDNGKKLYVVDNQKHNGNLILEI